jgi:hypothetical protein
MAKTIARSGPRIVVPVLVTCVLLSSSTRAQTAIQAANENARSEVAIREVLLDSGARLYSIPIKVGGTEIEAGLDTGSSGLRVLPGTLANGDAQDGDESDNYDYSSGVHYEGKIAKGTLTIGPLAASVTLQSIKSMTCRSGRPDCPASDATASDYGVRGNSLTGGRFRAILGVNMASADVASPLSTIGAARWIVELPRPGENVPGKLILNPTDEDIQDYVHLPILSAFHTQRGGLHDAVSGCLINLSRKDKACGALLMDTGISGVMVANGPFGRTPWPDGTEAALGFYDAHNPRLIETFSIGLREQASRLGFTKQPTREITIIAGQSPYLAFDILYDPANNQIGLKPRTVNLGGPQGAVVSGN